ncbi:Psma1 [Symbiodinium microadriaticum]|nr:Psma1 [Symbiodinium microadriaticum]
MFRNQYDTDVTVWSPQGRLHQVEYALEAVNQGTVCLGLRSSTHVVVAALRRSPNELASHQKKIEKIDNHMGIAMSGLTADGRSLVKPYGVGLLIAAYDQTGPHLYVTEPSGNYYEYFAMAIGSRSQTSRTYLEKEYESFQNLDVDDLIKHALKAIAASLSGDTELDASSVSVAVVGKDDAFKIIDAPRLQTYLDQIEVDQDHDGADHADMVLEDPDA